MPRPEAVGIDRDAGLPAGFEVVMDPGTKLLAPGVLFGGSPARILRVNQTGVVAIDELRRGPIASLAAAAVARRLTDANMAYPVVPASPGPPVGKVTVVIPVRDRAVELDRCLGALGAAHPVLVVDDGSADPERTAEICRSHGARLLRHDVNHGPGPARNTALREVTTPLVAFIDSDCVPPPDWISALAGHFADPLVGAVAGRLLALSTGPARTAAERYTGSRSPLDLGDRPSTVVPLTRVSYVPSANLVVRRAVIGGGFDEALRYGEDVDLVWRLIESGWRVRYDPSVEVAHGEPTGPARLLRRRYEYGTSAAPLTSRHPGSVAPLVLQPWPALTVGALLARRPLVAVATYSTGTLLLMRRLKRADLPGQGVLRPTAVAVQQTWLGVGRWATQFGSLALVAIVICPGGATRLQRWGRRLAALSLLGAPPVSEWRRVRPDLDPVRFTVAAVADEVAYGLGVWRGCWRERSVRAVLPVVSSFSLNRKERS